MYNTAEEPFRTGSSQQSAVRKLMWVMGEQIDANNFRSWLVSGMLRGTCSAESGIHLSVAGIDPSSGETQLAQVWPHCRNISGLLFRGLPEC